MDALEAHDRELAQRLEPAAKLAQALELMRVGIRLKLSALHQQYPQADEAEIAQRLSEWLCQDG